MDEPKEVECRDHVNPALAVTTQVSVILVLSHIFHIFLKPLGQHAPVAPILAGLVLGPSGLSRFRQIHKFFFQNFAVDFYESVSLYSRICIMFLIGLEMDIPFLMRNLRATTIIASGGCLTCTMFAASVTYFVYAETDSHGSHVLFALVLTVVLANTACPLVFRLVSDLRFATSDLGRLAISTSLVGDTYVIFILVIVSGAKYKETSRGWMLKAFASVLLLVGVVLFVRYVANWFNRRNRTQKSLKSRELMLICAAILAAAMTLESMGFSSIIACFLMGAMFPRGGKSARTLLSLLTYMVHNFIFPIYFGYSGFRADVTYLGELKNIALVAMVVLLSIGGKITGTLVACRYLRTPLKEGVLLAFLLNMKGHVDILTLTTATQNKVITSLVFFNLMILAVVVSSLISAVLIGFLVKRESDTIGAKHIPMVHHSPEKELILLACVHSPRPVSTILGLIVSLKGSENVPVSPYLMHLIELPDNKTNGSDSAYYQHEDDGFSSDEDYANDDVVEINEAVDIFTAETKTMIHQAKIVSPFSTMFHDVCDYADEIRASIVIVPFHKHQRIDGKLENDKEGIRTTNQKVLRHAQCTLAILVDRGHTARAHQAAGSESLQHVATLFFGGPDDREALGFSRRIGTHHHTNLTIIRFLPTWARDVNMGYNIARKDEDLLTAAPDNRAAENDVADSSALTNFYHSYVTSGKVGFVEKYADNGAETATILRDMAEMYSMFIVGKGGRGDSPLTNGISDWEECPELGVVGDFLASSEFDISGSVLVIQQHRPSLPDDVDDV